MIRIITSQDVVTGKVKYYEYAGLSTDTPKPTGSHISTGSLFHEVDTTKVYAYNEGTGEWVEQITLGGDGT